MPFCKPDASLCVACVFRRAWVVYSGATAPQAAGVIHTDFEKGFIKAEVAGFEVSRHSSQHTRCALPIVCGRFLSLLRVAVRGRTTRQ